MLVITCLLWGDDPSQGFILSVSPKDTVYNLKQKIVEYLDYGSNVYRKMRIIKLKEFITLDDERLKKPIDPRVMFKSEELDKPFQILDEYFSSKDDDLKEFPLDVIVMINNDHNVPIAILDKKEKETEIMAPHKPIGSIVRESALVTNNPSVGLSKKELDIDPSLFPSPPTFIVHKNNNSIEKRKVINNNDIAAEIVPRTKSLIFNIDRFPSPPDDYNNNNNNNISNSVDNINNHSASTSSNSKYIVYDIDQFPDAPGSEDFSITSKIPLTTTEDAPPSYDAISNKNQNILPNNNLYNMNNNSLNLIPNQYDMMKKDKKSVTIRKSVLISTCLCIGVMISTFLAIFLGKVLLQKGEESQQLNNKMPIIIGKVNSFKDTQGKPTSTITIATTTVSKPTPTYEIGKNEVIHHKENDDITSKLIFKDPEDTEVFWRINGQNELAVSLEIKNYKDNEKVKRDYKGNNFNQFLVGNNNMDHQYDNMIKNGASAYGVWNNNEKPKINGDKIDTNDFIDYNKIDINKVNENKIVETKTNETESKKEKSETNETTDQTTNTENNKADDSNDTDSKVKNDDNVTNNNEKWDNKDFNNMNYWNNNGFWNNSFWGNNNNNFFDPSGFNYNLYNNNNNNKKNDTSTGTNLSSLKLSDESLIREIIGENDLSLKVNIQIRRIVELSFNSTTYQNYIDLIPENEVDKPTVVDNSKNVSGGIIEIRRAFRQLNPDTNEVEKEVEVYQKLYTCSSKCNMRQIDEYNNEVDSTKYRVNILIKKWNFITDKDSKFQIHFDINSSKMYWTDVSSNALYFDKSQATFKYSDKNVFIENYQDIYTDKQNTTVKMDVYDPILLDGMKHFASDQGLRTTLSFNADMTNYKALQSITSSALSIKPNFNYLLFFTLFFIVLQLII